MSEKIPNQRYIYLNQTRPGNESFIIVKSIFAVNAASRLNKTGLRLYIYFLSQVPHTYNKTEKNVKRGSTPFYFYSSTAAKKLNLSQKGVQDGINELISFGYLIKLEEKDCYQFNDFIQEDLDIIPEEREKIVSLEEAIKFNQKQRDDELIRIASSLEDDSLNEQPRRHYDWE